MRIGFIGDVHGWIDKTLEYLADYYSVAKDPPELLIQLGDLELWRDSLRYQSLDWPGDTALTVRDEAIGRRYHKLCAKLPLPIYFLRGNHDCPGQLIEFSQPEHDLRGDLPEEKKNMRREIFPVDPHGIFSFATDGSILNMTGLNIAFLGGSETWTKVRQREHDPVAVAKLKALSPGSIDILVTHEGPKSLMPQERPKQGGLPHAFYGAGSKTVERIIEDMQPKFCLFGHVHLSIPPVKFHRTICIGLDGVQKPPLPQLPFDPRDAFGILDTGTGAFKFI